MRKFMATLVMFFGICVYPALGQSWQTGETREINSGEYATFVSSGFGYRIWHLEAFETSICAAVFSPGGIAPQPVSGKAGVFKGSPNMAVSFTNGNELAPFVIYSGSEAHVVDVGMRGDGERFFTPIKQSSGITLGMEIQDRNDEAEIKINSGPYRNLNRGVVEDILRVDFQTVTSVLAEAVNCN